MKLFRLFSVSLACAASFAASAQTFVSTSPSNKNVVLEELTGIRCQYCPDGHRTAAQLSANNPGRVVIVNIHAGSYAAPGTGQPDFRTSWGNAINARLAPSGYPAATISRRLFNNSLTTSSRTAWTTNSNTVLAEASPVNVAARCSLDVTTRQMIVNVEVYYTANAPGTANRLNVLLLQNNIAGPQTGGATYNPNAILPDGQYNHQHAFRHNLTPTWGDSIAANTTGSFQAFRYTYSVPNAISGINCVLPDLEVVAFVTQDSLNVLSGNKAQMILTSGIPVATDLLSPDFRVDFNTVCGSSIEPGVRVRNMGSTPISSLEISYTVNGGTAQTFNWTAPAAITTGQVATIPIPISGLSTTTANNIQFSVTQVNGQANPDAAETTSLNNITIANSISSSSDNLEFILRFDNYPAETTWSITNETTGAVVANGSGTGAANGSTINRTVTLVNGNCYSIKISDSAGDGIWSTQYGMGAYYVSIGGTQIYADSVFTSTSGFKFVYNQLVSVEQTTNINSVQLFPNPTSANLNMVMNLSEGADTRLEVVNMVGQTLQTVEAGFLQAGSHQFQFNTQELPNGAYFVVIRQNGTVRTERFTVLK
jgi:hypothetical protein